MAIAKIIVTDIIMAGSLFTEGGYDVEQSADNLAELKGQIIVEYLEGKYPGAEICADIAIQQDAGKPRPLEVLAFNEENAQDFQESAALQQQLSQRLAEGTAGISWAVAAA